MIARCDERDQDILLLEHGALNGLPRWRTEAHLRRCPRCQEQRERYARATSLMAETIREPDLPRWRPAAPALPIPARRPAAPPLLPAQPALASSFLAPTVGLRPVRHPALVASVALLTAIAAVASIAYQATILSAAPYYYQYQEGEPAAFCEPVALDPATVTKNAAPLRSGKQPRAHKHYPATPAPRLKADHPVPPR